MMPMNPLRNPLGGAPGLPATPGSPPTGSGLPGGIPPLGGAGPGAAVPPPDAGAAMGAPQGAPQMPPQGGPMTPQQTNRQRMTSDMLRAGATSAPQGQMVGGNFVAPSATQNMGQLANAMGYAYANRG